MEMEGLDRSEVHGALSREFVNVVNAVNAVNIVNVVNIASTLNP